jgi:hypothetical protein
MASADPSGLPNVADILAPLLARVPRQHQPLLLAVAERMAADRYRGWASLVTDPQHASDLIACAGREEEIADRIEELYPDAVAILEDVLSKNPDLDEINRSLFADRPLREQFTIQAQGERLGRATWRAFAQNASGKSTAVFLGCADLEEESAGVLDALLAAGVE